MHPHEKAARREKLSSWCVFLFSTIAVPPPLWLHPTRFAQWIMLGGTDRAVCGEVRRGYPPLSGTLYKRRARRSALRSPGSVTESEMNRTRSIIF